jgi:hypothetical protein
MSDSSGTPPNIFPGDEIAPGIPEAAPSGIAVADTPPPAPPSAPPAAPDVPRPPGQPYPMRYDIAYPERLSRWKTLLRGILIIPAWLVLDLLQWLLFVALLLGWTTVFWRKKYPTWLFSAASGGLGYTARVMAYTSLQTDKYPSFDREASPVTLEYDDPPQGLLSRWRVLFWKLMLLIPHLFVLYFLSLGVLVVTILAWFAILFTGHYPRGMFAFVTGVQRWQFRVAGYFASFNDRFPPFALSAEAGPGAKSSAVICGVVGLLAGGACTGGITAAVILSNNPATAQVSYANLKQGRGFTFYLPDRERSREVIALQRVVDPGADQVAVLKPPADSRIVVFEWTLQVLSGAEDCVGRSAARLKVRNASNTESFDAEIITVGGHSARACARGAVPVHAVFVIPANAVPLELRFSPESAGLGGLKYIFD